MFTHMQPLVVLIIKPLLKFWLLGTNSALMVMLHEHFFPGCILDSDKIASVHEQSLSIFVQVTSLVVSLKISRVCFTASVSLNIPMSKSIVFHIRTGAANKQDDQNSVTAKSMILIK